ncbi:cytidine deaminase-like protein [Hyaloscypha bicolor E]|uniref:Cytidine deaminase-like protein n=1 Tax=Hyaloscypha bicolor E TaxID=1095630 RepID=A0A2J6T2S0_9HELO|nr:cytidine deaminase-like protein [Hyaloscypha bicolor E]PMD57324.1 cytidine deaminase-like protein [Hyaloscypha bicolor E]
MASEAALTPEAARSIAPHLFPARTPITKAQIEAGINVCLDIQRRAVTFGKRPFAACLLGSDNETVLLMHQSIDQVNHAESSLARLAYSHYSKAYLWQCTLVSTWEPCAMCSSTIYWAHIGRVVYAASNEQLAQLTGPGNKENFTMNWHTRDILLGQQKDVEIIGPVEGMDKTVVEESDVYWKTTR